MAVHSATDRPCPPSGRMEHLQADLWHLPDYPRTFDPSTPGINSETEVLAFMYALVLLSKPLIVVETGSYCGMMARALAAGCATNDLGMVHTFDTDPDAYAATREALKWHGQWSEAHLQPALERADLIRSCDLLFSDSSYESRVQEVKLLKPGAVGVLHDTGMEDHLDRHIQQEYPRNVFIATPRGLTIFQR